MGILEEVNGVLRENGLNYGFATLFVLDSCMDIIKEDYEILTDRDDLETEIVSFWRGRADYYDFDRQMLEYICENILESLEIYGLIKRNEN